MENAASGSTASAAGRPRTSGRLDRHSWLRGPQPRAPDRIQTVRVRRRRTRPTTPRPAPSTIIERAAGVGQAAGGVAGLARYRWNRRRSRRRPWWGDDADDTAGGGGRPAEAALGAGALGAGHPVPSVSIGALAPPCRRVGRPVVVVVVEHGGGRRVVVAAATSSSPPMSPGLDHGHADADDPEHECCGEEYGGETLHGSRDLSSRSVASGAGDGNRTRMTSLEGWGSTIELHPQSPRR